MPAKLYTIRDRALCPRDLENQFRQYLMDAYGYIEIEGINFNPGEILEKFGIFKTTQLSWQEFMVEKRYFVFNDGNYYPAEDGYDD